MKTMKKAISVLLLVCMVSALCSAGAYADEKQMNFDNAPTSMNVGDTSPRITVSGYNINDPAKVYWANLESSDTSIISVDTNANTLTAVKAGEATITSKCWISDDPNSTYNSANEKYIATKKITVVDTAAELTAKITQNGNTLTVAASKGGTPATITNVDWSSSNTNITVTSNGGNIATATIASTTPDADQTATITANVTVDGGGTAIATKDVTIPKANIPVTSVMVTPATANVAPGGQVQMSAKVLPENAAQNVTWSVTGSATIDQKGLVTANGTAANGDKITVTATAQDGSAKAGTATITVVAPPTITVDIIKDSDGSYTAKATFSDGNSHRVDWDWSCVPNNGITLNYHADKCIVTNTNPTDVTISLTATATATINDAPVAGSKTLDNITIPGTPREVSAKLSPNADPLTVGDTTNTKTLVAYYNDDSNQTPIEGVTWVTTAQNPASGNVANLNGNKVTAGSVPGTVTYEAYLNNAATGAKVTVTVNAAKSNVNLNISQLNKPANVDGFTITAKGGVISLTAAATDATTGAALSGTYSWFISSAPIFDGIGLTDNKNATATVSGKYNGSGSNAYTVGVTFTPSDTTKYDVKNTYCAINVKFAHVIDSGNNQVWDGRNGMSFITNDSYYNCSYDVRIDGQLIGNGNGYTVVSSPDGRMLVTLTPDCLKYIATYYNGNGTHTISIGNKNAAAATGYFRTWGTASSFNGVKTGDDANPGLWAALLAVSAVGAGAAVIIVKRRKTNNG